MENEENTRLLQTEEPISKGEKSPENDHADEIADVSEPETGQGFPLEPVGESLRIGGPRLLPGQRYWSTDFFSVCGGTNDEFFMDDTKACLLGTFLPGVLFGLNSERLNPEQNRMFWRQCCLYYILSFVSMGVLRQTWFAQWYAVPGRVAVRKAYNLKGYGVSCLSNLGWCSGMLKSEGNREDCNSLCDCLLHCWCHPCALCQEAREIHRRTAIPHLGHLQHTTPPSQQSMDVIS